MLKAKISVMGSFIVDLMARAPHLPVIGETVKGTTFKIGPGGKGSNQAVAAQRSGVDVTMITKIGNDDFAEIALKSFTSEGMSTKYIFQDEKYETGTALIMVDENTSENKIMVTVGACGHITEDDIEKAREDIENSEVLLTQLEANIDATEKAVEIAYQQGVKTILNPAPAQQISDELIKKIDILTPNETEASLLCDGVEINTVEDAKKAATILMAKGAKNVIVTLGNKGSMVVTQSAERYIKSLKVDVVDTTGGGDAYNGGLAAALAEGKDIFEAAEFANAVAALCVTKKGTAPAMPYRDEIEKIIEETKSSLKG